MNIKQSTIMKRIFAVDWLLIIITLCAVGFGLVLVKSATNYTNSSRRILIQCISAAIGLACAFFMSSIDYDHAMKYSKYFYAISIAMLVVTLVFGTGEDEFNSQSWLIIPGIEIGVQTSEISKILFIVTLSKHLETIKENINKPLNVLGLLLHLGIVTGLVLLQNDLGNALVFVFIFFVMCFISGISLWYLLASLFLIVAFSPLIWSLMSEYQKMRIMLVGNPEIDPYGFGWQVIQAMKAIGSGEIFGAGFQEGYMIQNHLIAMQDTDMIFTVAGEEFGVLGTLSVIMIFIFLLMRIFKVSKVARNDAGMLICMGVMAMFMFQAIVNIGMCVNLMPVIGITLPFFSYGGSSMVSSFLGIGLVLSVYSHRSIYYFNQADDML